jgi:hypothetical protein
LQEGRADFKALRPLRPPAGGVASAHSENRGTFGGIVVALDGTNFLTGQLPKPVDFAGQIGRLDLLVNFHFPRQLYGVKEIFQARVYENLPI